MRRLALLSVLLLGACAAPMEQHRPAHVFGYTPIPGGSGGGYAPASWFDKAAIFLLANAAGTTECAGAKLGVTPAGAAVTPVAGNGVDANVEGGGYKGLTNATAVALSGATVWQTPLAGQIAVEFRAKFPAVGTAVQGIGLINAASTHVVEIALQSTVDATHWYIQLSDGTPATTPLAVADTSWHDFALIFDGTTVTAYKDGVSMGTTTTLTHFPTDPMEPFLLNTTSTISVSKAEWCYAAP